MSIQKDIRSSRKVVKGKLGDLTFQLNPSEMKHLHGNTYVDTNSPGGARPIISFAYGKPNIMEFKLWFYSKHEQPVDMADVYVKLNKYRNTAEPVIFAYGSYAGRCIVTDCDFEVKAWTNQLVTMEMEVPVKLQFI